MVGDGALDGVEGVDEVFGQFLTFGEEVVLGVELVIDDLGDGFAIADGGEAVFVDALLDEVVDDGLGTTLREVEVVGLSAYAIGEITGRNEAFTENGVSGVSRFFGGEGCLYGYRDYSRWDGPGDGQGWRHFQASEDGVGADSDRDGGQERP